MSVNESQKTGADRRKYQRVQFEASPQTLSVSVVGYGPTIVFDMSFSGAALAQPADKKVVTTGETISLHLRTTEVDSRVTGRVVRCTDKIVAVEFTEIPVEARLLVDRLISDRMIGLNMNLIDPKHYSASSSFTYWFHGPKETNLFLWTTGEDRLEKAQFDLNNVVLVYEEDKFFFENKQEITNPGIVSHQLNRQQILQKANAILSQMHTNLDGLNSLKDLVAKQIA